MLAVYSGAHFVVDFACAFLMFRALSETRWGYICLLLYNFCAFAMQMPLGILAHKLDKNAFLAAAGCSLIGAAYGLHGLPLLAAAAAGLGNGAFHVSGGMDILNGSDKSGALGIFVSPGALGVYLGTLLGRADGMPLLMFPPALLTAAALILIVCGSRGGSFIKNAAFSLGARGDYRVLFFAVCLFLVVCLRSYIGLTLSFPWKSSGQWALTLASAAALGKASGGFVANRFGTARCSSVSLGLAALLFLFPSFPAAGVLAVLLFNMTMPVTLWAMAKLFPGAKGFSFGLLTFGLFLGFLPGYLGAPSPPGAPWCFAAAAVVSLLLLRAGTRTLKL